MSRTFVTLAAAAASAFAAAAIVALPASGDDAGGKPPRGNADGGIAEFVSCLSAHGLDAPSAIDEFKPWLARESATHPRATKAAELACQADKPDVGNATIPDEFISCVRDRGLDAPTEPAAFDRWLRRTEATDPEAVEPTLLECKRAVAPASKPGDAAKPGDCAAASREKAAAVDSRN
jgi:hypothetical protein